MSQEIELAAPERADMQRGDDVRADGDGHASEASCNARRRCRWRRPPLLRQRIAIYVGRHLSDIRDYLVTGLRNDLCSGETYGRCLMSCVFFFFCHACATVFLHVCFCCRCMTFLLTAPERLVPRNPAEKFFSFVAKQLSNLWVTALLALFAQWVLFRPFTLKPRLGLSAVHEFELLQSPASMPGSSAPPHLRFNATTYLLFKNTHSHYKMSYKHLAVSALYADQKLGPEDDELPSFKQKPHRSTAMRLVFAGQLRNASHTVAETFASDKGQGALRMVVRIRVTQAYKFWPFKPEYFSIYDCPLSLPFPRAGKPGVSSAAWCKTIFTA